jgi:hypothetical protein
MKVHRIVIDVDATGNNIVLSQITDGVPVLGGGRSSVTEPDDTVSWEVPPGGGNFALLFKKKSPFKDKITKLRRGGPGAPSAPLPLRKLGEQFDYTVALCTPAKCLIEDPDIIIDDSGGGGAAKGRKKPKGKKKAKAAKSTRRTRRK